MDGGEGADFMTGGSGADTFVFESVLDSPSDAMDIIDDFNVAEGDKIDLEALGVTFEDLTFQLWMAPDGFTKLVVGVEGADFAFELLHQQNNLTADAFIF